MITTFVGLGSNLDDPVSQLLTAFDELAALPSSRLIRRSSLFRSKPLGPQDQDDFVNAVAEVQTELDALTLLSALQAIETQHQRVKTRHWGPRTLDLDLLLYADESINLKELVVPHAQMLKRNFVLVPLTEIAPKLSIPGAGFLSEQLVSQDYSGLEKINDSE